MRTQFWPNSPENFIAVAALDSIKSAAFLTYPERSRKAKVEVGPINERKIKMKAGLSVPLVVHVQ